MNLLADWDKLESLSYTFAVSLQYLLLPIIVYHLIVSAFGWVKRKETPADKFPPENRFAIVVAAHNEEMVVGNIVRNLRELNYPKELFDVFVIADNCSDDTAKTARENGALVYERFDGEKKGKGFALEWMFEKIFKMDKQYDAVCVFDADNLASPNFLMEMNKQLSRGYKVIQGYLDSKNPMDSIISGSYSITYWLNNRVFQLARYYLGLSCAIGGTGFVVSTGVLKEIGWGATCLTEDLEFTIKLVLKGMKVHWSHEAKVYDEKPLTMSQSWRQRKRWMQGQADCAFRYLKALLSKTVKERSLVAFDVALYLIQPAIIVISGIGMVLNLLRFILFFDFSRIAEPSVIASAAMLFLVTYISGIFVFIEGKINAKVIGCFLLFPIYNLTWVPIIIQGFIDRNKREWCHTVHIRAVDLGEVEHLENVG